MRIQDRTSFWRPAVLAALVLLPLAYWPLGALVWRALTPDGAAARASLHGVSGAAFSAIWHNRALLLLPLLVPAIATAVALRLLLNAGGGRGEAMLRTLARGIAVLTMLAVLGPILLATAAASQAGALTVFRTDTVHIALINTALSTIDAAMIAITLAMATVAALRQARTGPRRFIAGALLLPAALTPRASNVINP